MLCLNCNQNYISGLIDPQNDRHKVTQFVLKFAKGPIVPFLEESEPIFTNQINFSETLNSSTAIVDTPSRAKIISDSKPISSNLIKIIPQNPSQNSQVNNRSKTSNKSSKENNQPKPSSIPPKKCLKCLKRCPNPTPSNDIL